MIRLVEEIKNDITSFNRNFIIKTEKGYGLSTVLGFIKYQLGTSKVKLVHEKDFTTSERAIYSIYNNEGISLGRAVCYMNVNQFDITYDVGVLFQSRITINQVY